jgi:TonB family protein
MESFGKQGSGQMSVPLGNTLMTEPDNKPRPKRVEPYVVPPATPPPPPPRPRDVFKPIPIFEIDENPKELKKVSAEYPPDAKRDGVEAVVVLSVQIRSNGQVRRARVISIRPTQAERYDFGRNAVRALQRYRFQPAKYQGRPVDVVVRYIYRFVLED